MDFKRKNWLIWSAIQFIRQKGILELAENRPKKRVETACFYFLFNQKTFSSQTMKQGLNIQLQTFAYEVCP